MNVFIAGPRAVSSLNKHVKERLNNLVNNNFEILVGDANGIDKQIQSFFNSVNYNAVKVFASNGKARNNIGGWKVESVNVQPGVKGFDFYAAKDMEMAKAADYGFMIWNGKSKGTLNNINNLVKLNKKVLVYLIPNKQFYTICDIHDIDKLFTKEKKTIKPYNSETNQDIEQLSWFSN